MSKENGKGSKDRYIEGIIDGYLAVKPAGTFTLFFFIVLNTVKQYNVIMNDTIISLRQASYCTGD